MTDEEIVKSYINKNDVIKDKDEFYRIIKWHSEKNNISLYESLAHAYLSIVCSAIKKNIMDDMK